MSLWLKDKKIGVYSQLGVSNWETVNSTITWKWVKLLPLDKTIAVYGVASEISNIQKFGEGTKWLFKEQPVIIRFNKEFRQVWDKEGKKWEEKPVLPLEGLLFRHLSTIHPNDTYAGQILLQNSPLVVSAYLGKTSEGDADLPESFIQLVTESLENLYPTDLQPDQPLLNVEDFKELDTSSKRFSSTSRETERDRLTARVNWLVDQCKLIEPSFTYKTLDDLHSVTISERYEPEVAKRLIQALESFALLI